MITTETRYEVETGYSHENFDFASSTHGHFTQFRYTDNNRLTLRARFQAQEKFEEKNTRFTLGAVRRFLRRTYLSGQASFAPTGRVVANQDYSLEFTQGLHPSFYAGMGYRFMNFRVANAHVLTVLADAHPRANLHLYIRYLPSRTLFGAGIPGVWNHSGWARLEWDIDRRFSPYVAFAVGSESFASFSVDKLGRFSAQTYGAGARINLNRRQGFRVGYFFQNRTLGRRQQSVSASWIFRF